MGRLNTVQRYEEAETLIRIATSHREVAQRTYCHNSTIDKISWPVSRNQHCAGSAQIWTSNGYKSTSRSTRHVDACT